VEGNSARITPSRGIILGVILNTTGNRRENDVAIWVCPKFILDLTTTTLKIKQENFAETAFFVVSYKVNSY
jgi:hypothetical protein